MSYQNCEKLIFRAILFLQEVSKNLESVMEIRECAWHAYEDQDTKEQYGDLYVYCRIPGRRRSNLFVSLSTMLAGAPMDRPLWLTVENDEPLWEALRSSCEVLDGSKAVEDWWAVGLPWPFGPEADLEEVRQAAKRVADVVIKAFEMRQARS
ncbi:hypothetical protein [Desulfosoma sp.]